MGMAIYVDETRLDAFIRECALRSCQEAAEEMRAIGKDNPRYGEISTNFGATVRRLKPNVRTSLQGVFDPANKEVLTDPAMVGSITAKHWQTIWDKQNKLCMLCIPFGT